MPYNNPIIEKRLKEKIERLNRQTLSINLSWAINNANAFLPENLRGTEEGFELIKKWYPKFLELYREWMLENMPIQRESKTSFEKTKKAFLEDIDPEEVEVKVDPL